MEEESFVIVDNNQDLLSEPRCLCYDIVPKKSSETVQISERKEFILTTVARTESYLRERRIPELIRFLFTMVISHSPNKPISFLEKLLDDCMLFRAGYGLPPVLYEKKHLDALITSFDPSQRGWLSIVQVQRLYAMLGFACEELLQERIPCDFILNHLKKTQETELLQLLSSGVVIEDHDDDLKSNSSSN